MPGVKHGGAGIRPPRAAPDERRMNGPRPGRSGDRVHKGSFTGAQARAAMQGHVLGEAHLSGTYTLNPRLRVPDGGAA